MNRSTHGEAAADRWVTRTHGHRGFLDKWLFFMMFVIGASGIVLLRTYFGVSQMAVTAWAVFWMVFYLISVTWVPRYYLRADQAGDNIYYMGFLFTLVSLSVALYYFTDQAVALDQIVANFGIALATTILGVALRVVMHQMREDPVDTEREARLDLAEASSRLRTELDVSVQRLDSFARHVEQSVEEAITRVGEAAQNVLRKSSEQIAESGEKVALSSQQASAGIESAFTEFKDQAKNLTAASRRQVKATETLVERMEAIEVPAGVIKDRLAPVGELLERLAGQVEARERATSSILAGFAKASESMSRSAEAMRDQLTTTHGQMGQMGALLQKVQEALGPIDRIGAALGPTEEVITRFGDVLATTASAQETALRQQVETLDELHVQLRDGFGAFQGALQEHSQKAAEQMAEAIRTVSGQQSAAYAELERWAETRAQETLDARKALEERQRQVYERLAEEMEATFQGIRRAREDTEREARLAREATEDVLRQLTGMVRTLGAQLGGPPSDPSEP